MQAPYDRERGQAPGGGDHGWHPDQPGEQPFHGQPEQDPGYDQGYWQPPPQTSTHHHPYPGSDYPYQSADPHAGHDFAYGQAASSPPPDYPHPQQPYVQQPHSQQPYSQQPPPQQPHAHQPYPQQRPPEQPTPEWQPAPQPYQAQGSPAHGEQQSETDDAFAYLFRDQHTGRHGPPAYRDAQAPPAAKPPSQPPPPDPAHAPPPPAALPADQEPAEETDQGTAARGQGRTANLLRSSAVMAAGTLVSRITGFFRQLVIVAALGTALLGDTYTVAWALPSMIYILTIGGGLNSVFVPQLVRAMKYDPDGGDAYANRLLTLVMAALGGLVIVAVLAAPLLVRLMSATIADDPAANEVTVTFARYFLPTIFFMGVHVVLGQILNARDRFGPMMWTPVLNNIVVIFTFGMFLWVYGTERTSTISTTSITDEGVQLLGVGTLLGLVVQGLAMVPYLRAAGFRFQLRFDWRGHGMGKSARLAKWTMAFVLANQIGLVVITQFSTWAGATAQEAGYPGTGYIAFSSALLIWQMPQAIITVSVMAALLPRLSRSAADGDTAAVRDDLSHGLRTSAVAIVPMGFAFVALGVPICTLLFGSGSETGARSFGYILMAFGVGLIPYSAQYVVLRVFYAYEDTRTPFTNTLLLSSTWIALSALCFVMLPARWVVAGIALSHGVAYALSVSVAWRRLRRRLGTDLDGARIVRTYIRLVGASVPASLAAGVAGLMITGALGDDMLGSLATLLGGGLLFLVIFYLAARRMRIEELTVLVGMVRARLGR